MKIFDTHCHYNLSPLYENWQQHWQKAQEHGVVGSIVVGATIETSRRAVEIAQQDKRLFAAVAVHPDEYSNVWPSDAPSLLTQHISSLEMMIDDPDVVAVGETGLDYYRLSDENREQAMSHQQSAFRAHIDLANRYRKILIVHVRDKGGKKNKNNQAYWDALNLIKNHYECNKPFILHCVSGPEDYIDEAIELGGFVGIDGNITYPSATKLRAVIKNIPSERVLLETDAPYLPPQEFRGQTCEPWMISKTAEYCSKYLNLNEFTTIT